MAVSVKGLNAKQIADLAQKNAAAEAQAKAERETAVQAEIFALREANRILADQVKASKAATHGLTMKVSEKGGLSVYGIGRFPTTLYIEQWQRIIDVVKNGELERFIDANRSTLKTKAPANA